MKRWLVRLFLFVLVAGATVWVWRAWTTEAVIAVTTTELAKGPLELLVTTTGRLSPITEVVVGCEVSGTVEAVLVDHNDRVTRGQALARLKPELYRAEHEQAKADLARAAAELHRLAVQAAEAQREYDRIKSLYERQVENENAYRSAEAVAKAAQAAAEAGQAVVDSAASKVRLTAYRLDRSVITSPIDGVVLDRRVDAGQTIAATLQSPALFVLAEDLSRMQLLADVSEADIGYLCPGQSVTFTVDAYRDRRFEGTVMQIRNQPRTVRDVVTYTVVVDVRNEDRLLRPGMTADVSVRIIRREDVLKIANTALRFRPPLSPDDTRALLAQVDWPPAPPPLKVAADLQATQAAGTAQTAPGDFVANPPPIDPVQATLWEYVDRRFKPRGVWTLFTDNRETAVYTGADAVGGEFVTEARKPEPGRSRLHDAIVLSRPENRVGILTRKK
ncbi:MAG: efflux RND transporter periplasmic adaptor subunit [Planctomycetes bacterium]|nr:efflux RND transporter periplasmic adaptor subunit [Planctomycetota bacterium]